LSELNRLENESFLDYTERLIEAKENNLIDIDKAEIWDILFGEKVSSDHARKSLFAVKKLITRLRDEGYENITEGDALKELEIKKQQFEKEKIKFQDQRREYYKLLRIDARFEHLQEQLEKYAQEIAEKKPLVWYPVNNGLSNKEGVLLCSDWHSELEVDNFMNKFNKEEFLRRINKLVAKTIEYGKLHNIKTLHVFNLGDLLAGIIHLNIRIANNELTVSQTMFIGELLAEILSKFANEFENVKFYNVLDNHSRVFANKEESLAGESFARFFPWYLKPRLKDFENIEIVKNELDEDIIVTEICEKVCFAVHGHRDSLKSVVNDLSMMVRKIPDYVFVSHWHHNIEDEIHSCEVIVNQSLIGVDDHSKNIRKTSKPAQKFMIFNKEDGRECSYSIRLDN
jgi:hypothetical protein